MKDNWYAANIISSRKYVLAKLVEEGIETYRVGVLPNLVFLHCNLTKAELLRQDFWGSMIFYMSTDKEGHKVPARIPDQQMINFIMVTSASPEDIIELNLTDKTFLLGQKVRVTGGPFKGVVGVVKRIKGDRRLVVELKGVAIVATPFIHPSLLENVE